MLFLVPLYCMNNTDLNKYNCTHAMRINNKLMMYCNNTKNHQSFLKYDMQCFIYFTQSNGINITCSFANDTKCMIYGNCYLFQNNNGIIGHCYTQYGNILAPFVNKYNLTCTNTETYFFDMCVVNTSYNQLGFIIPIIAISAILLIIFVTYLIGRIKCMNNNVPQLSAPIPTI